MEQPCYKCGQVVEQGVPFCPQCAAPQIRVALPEPPTEILAPAAISEGTVFLPSSRSPNTALPMRWSTTVQPCALAALAASVLMSLGLNPFVAMFGVGFLSVV